VLLNFRRDHRADAAKPRLAILLLGAGGDKITAHRFRVFGDDTKRKMFSHFLSRLYRGANAFIFEGNFRDQNHVCAAGQSA
jgi:hypothetical protein